MQKTDLAIALMEETRKQHTVLSILPQPTENEMTIKNY